MKITTKNMLVQLDRIELNNLTKEVKETICVDVKTSPIKKQFTVAELDRIQQGERVRLIGRRYF